MGRNKTNSFMGLKCQLQLPRHKQTKHHSHKCLETSANILCLLQAIAHYEQAADYYKGEESTRLAHVFFVHH